jgi:hypothetical protein
VVRKNSITQRPAPESIRDGSLDGEKIGHPSRGLALPLQVRERLAQLWDIVDRDGGGAFHSTLRLALWLNHVPAPPSQEVVSSRKFRRGYLDLRTPCGAKVRSRAAPFDMDRIANVE